MSAQLKMWSPEAVQDNRLEQDEVDLLEQTLSAKEMHFTALNKDILICEW